MSYILDALRKSESERRQGRVPDLGQQVQLIHKPKKKSPMALALIGAGLMLNAAVLAYVFWPGEPAKVPDSVSSEQAAPATPIVKAEQESVLGAIKEPEAEPQTAEADASVEVDVEEPELPERPTIIVPSRERLQPSANSAMTQAPFGAVPHLIELPLEFQRSIPDLVFNSHLYGSEPSSRRVMINNNYLRAGESFSGIRIDKITEEGVILSKNGRRFRVGIVRDWVSPQ